MTERPPAARARRSHRACRRRSPPIVAALVTLIVAVALLSFALPRTVALFLMIPADVTVSQAQRRVAVERAALDRAVEAGIAASAWVESGPIWQQVAQAHLGRLQLADAAPAEKVDALLLAEATLRRSLARRPGNPFAWWQLAAVRQALGEPHEQVTSALYLSVVTGNMVSTLVFPRLRLALALWPHLDPAARAAFRPQLALALRGAPSRLVTLVRRSAAEEHVRAMLRDDRELRRLYETLLARLPTGSDPAR